jgi:tRNA-splicing ligase RtcB (3'-phosphate/5'-hydroxy nucleic acid ligase)
MKLRLDPYQTRAREFAIAAGVDPDARVPMVDKPGRTSPAWCEFRQAARDEQVVAQATAFSTQPPPQDAKYADAPLKILGEHDEGTVQQMRNCMRVGNVVSGVICADGHLGYAQPVGGVIAYENQISISGIGFDIGCGNQAIRLDTRFSDIADNAQAIARDIANTISFGVGRINQERVDHELFDDTDAWRESGMEDYRQKAMAQLGTCGSGNHYVDILRDEDDYVWIGVHFGSRGLGHTTATRYLKLAGGQDGMNVPPAVVNTDAEIGVRYLAGMHLAGRYAYAGREWVVERVRQIIGGQEMDRVHNHHNFAWQENGLWVVRKGATPAFPGQRGFVGGSMGDIAVIIEGIESDASRSALHSTIHGAGRLFGRKEAKRRFARETMDAWLKDEGVTLIGADLDESPMAYRRLPDVLNHHAHTIKVLHTLKPFVVVMAGNEVDPWKD